MYVFLGDVCVNLIRWHIRAHQHKQFGGVRVRKRHWICVFGHQLVVGASPKQGVIQFRNLGRERIRAVIVDNILRRRICFRFRTTLPQEIFHEIYNNKCSYSKLWCRNVMYKLSSESTGIIVGWTDVVNPALWTFSSLGACNGARSDNSVGVLRSVSFRMEDWSLSEVLVITFLDKGGVNNVHCTFLLCRTRSAFWEKAAEHARHRNMNFALRI